MSMKRGGMTKVEYVRVDADSFLDSSEVNEKLQREEDVGVLRILRTVPSDLIISSFLIGLSSFIFGYALSSINSGILSNIEDVINPDGKKILPYL